MAGDVTPPPQPTGKSRTVSLRIFNFVEDKIGVPFPVPTPSALRQINREVKNADILILHDCLYLSNILTFLAARWRGIPVLIIQHTGHFPNGAKGISLMNVAIGLFTPFVTWPMLSRASQVVFVGETTKKFFKRLPFKRPPEVIFNGVDTRIFRKLERSETVPALRHEYGLPEDAKVILFVGRFVERKGLSVMRQMAGLRPRWIWAFAGWGPLDPTTWNAANVRVFSGLPDSSLARLYRCCDLLVLPSTGEGGFPLVAREALISGIPVVCAEETLRADPAMRDFVVGAPVCSGDEDSTARNFLVAIENILSRGAAFREEDQKADSQRSWDCVADEYIKIISRLGSLNASIYARTETGSESRCQ
jgi:glycosyltransferase involved in cell wall biosynthesis